MTNYEKEPDDELTPEEMNDLRAELYADDIDCIIGYLFSLNLPLQVADPNELGW